MKSEIIPIRFHHLPEIQKFYFLGVDQYQRYLVTNTQSLRQKATNVGSYAEYIYEDTIGSADKEQIYCTAIIATMRRYWELGDQTPIKLIATNKDLICQVCSSGTHCNQAAGYRAEANITYSLQEAMREHNIKGPYKELGSKILQTFHVLTTMGLVKSILRSEPNLFD